ncbi:MAG: nucleotidyl transferase AbiEii/AbiGii toxin family protein [Alphaproteobacteria bacterium]|nr:nucleotidyl transferase AbiEii/AbiGii toxin family protein [Alphaproteobacteria bacterium]
MDKVAFASDLERKSLFIDAADKTDIADFIIEKDFWVSWVLGKIFADKYLSEILCFKGGTSLSKAFGLIDRFSEDIDLILSEHTVLKTGEKLEQSSNNKQAEFNKEVVSRAGHFISTRLKDKIAKMLESVCKVEADIKDDHVLFVKFPRVFDYSYIQPDIKLEIGPLALWNPNEKYSISSFITVSLPELELANPIIPTIKPERTFWEKITILHHEHHRPETSPLSPRYSRHYYDVFKMGNSKVKEEALANLKLLEEVVAFKKRFYPRGWAKYDEAVPGTIRLYPAKQNLKDLEQDYIKMQKMIFGTTPSWEEILAGLKELEDEINKKGS